MYDRVQHEHNLSKPSKSGIITRSQRKKLLKLKRPRTEKFKQSLAYSGPIKWNALPELMQHERSKEAFKLVNTKWARDKALENREYCCVSLVKLG